MMKFLDGPIQQTTQATEQQHVNDYGRGFANRQAASLGTLDAHGLAGLHAAVVDVVNRDMYDLSDNGNGVVDAERLAQDIIAEVVRRAAPATAGRVK